MAALPARVGWTAFREARNQRQKGQMMKTRHVLSSFVAVVVALVATPALRAASQRPVELPERFRGADHAVVAHVAGAAARFERNKWGDELIVTRLRLQVDEVLKGAPAAFVELDVEGGTLGDLTLEVSDMPSLHQGDRGVFFLKRSADSGAFVPHLRGQGIVRLDNMDRVPGTSLTLDTIRQAGRAAK
jgi:hypothetical protein